MAALSRIKIWRFPDAPEELRSLCIEDQTPDWLALVPCCLADADVEKLMQRQIDPLHAARYETATRDVVYTGSSPTSVERKIAGRAFAKSADRTDVAVPTAGLQHR